MSGDRRPPDRSTIMDLGCYCRDVESYLCRKNDGHLVRIVGPAFELVCGWAERQIPLRVVFGAIDRTCVRRQAKRRSRRPVRIEFCETDVLELFDEWRRAVGVGTAASATPTAASRKPSLGSHIERAVERLTAWRWAGDQAPAVTDLAAACLDELGALQGRARRARGSERQEIVARLGEIERHLTATLHDVVDPTAYKALRAEAARELEPFQERMPRDALVRAKNAGTDRLLYDHFKFPRITFE